MSLASKRHLQFAIVCEDIRRVVANRFPYSVYFRAEKHRIVVLVVFHGSRDPHHFGGESLTLRLSGHGQKRAALLLLR